MILAEDIRSIRNTLLCAKGQEVTAAVRLQLRNYIVNVGLSGPITVFVPLEEADPEAEQPLVEQR